MGGGGGGYAQTARQWCSILSSTIIVLEQSRLKGGEFRGWQCCRHGTNRVYILNLSRSEPCCLWPEGLAERGRGCVEREGLRS